MHSVLIFLKGSFLGHLEKYRINTGFRGKQTTSVSSLGILETESAVGDVNPLPLLLATSSSIPGVHG